MTDPRQGLRVKRNLKPGDEVTVLRFGVLRFPGVVTHVGVFTVRVEVDYGDNRSITPFMPYQVYERETE